MMTNYFALFISLFGAFLAAITQYLLKKEASIEHSSLIGAYLNLRVISAYTILLIITAMNLYALKFLPISLMPMIEATSFIHVAIISHFFLHEKISKKKILGLVLIMIGLLIASIR